MMPRKLAALTTPAGIGGVAFTAWRALYAVTGPGSIRITQKLSRRAVVDHRNGVWVHNLDFRLHILRFGEPGRVMHPHQVVCVDADNVQVRDAEGRPVYSQGFLIRDNRSQAARGSFGKHSGSSLAAVSQLESRTTSTTFRWGSLASPNLLLKHLAADDRSGKRRNRSRARASVPPS